MFGWILKFFGGSIVEKLTGAWVKHKDAETEDDRIKADVYKKQLDTELEAQRLAQQVRIATAGFWEMRVLTALIALPFVVHLNLVALDTCFKFGWRVAAFPHPFDEWQGAILLSFFGIAVGGRVATGIVGAIIAKRGS
jgi:hypothetical protein